MASAIVARCSEMLMSDHVSPAERLSEQSASRARPPGDKNLNPRRGLPSKHRQLQEDGRSDSTARQPDDQDPLEAALRRGERARQSILAAQGELLNVAEVAARLGVGEEDVLRLQSRGRLLALPLPDGALAFPAWQFAERGLLPGLDLVLRNIGVDDPWMQAAYFLSGELRLDGRTPLEMLRRGEVEAVRRAAAAYGEQLAS